MPFFLLGSRQDLSRRQLANDGTATLSPASLFCSVGMAWGLFLEQIVKRVGFFFTRGSDPSAREFFFDIVPVVTPGRRSR